MSDDSQLQRAYRVLDRHPGRGAHRGRPEAGRAAIWKRLLAFNAGLLDRATIRIMEPIFLSGDPPYELEGIRDRIEDAHLKYSDPALFQDPDKFYRPVGQPAEFRLRDLGRLKGGARVRVTFKSSYQAYDPDYAQEFAEHPRNAMNYVHLWRHNDAARPTVICVHPWCLGFLRFDEVVFAARSLYKLGLNVALFTMPFHGRRTPPRRFPGQLFPSHHVPRTNEAFGQAVADLRVLKAYLQREQGAGPVGMMGFSLGGYTTALMASLDPELAFAIPIVAPATFADLMWTHGENRPRKQEAERAGLGLWDLRRLFGIHCPLMHRLQIPKDDVLMIWGAGDRIVPSVHQLALWEHWGRPRIRAYHGGHMIHFGRMAYMREITRWLKERVL